MATIEQPLSASPAPATISATLIYNPEGDPNNKFAWVTETGQPFLFVGEPGTILTVTLENAVFAANPISFISKQNHFTVNPRVSGQEISILIIDKPTSYFNPWIISFNVDAGGANGINSPTFFLVLPPSSQDSTSVDLQYSSRDGSFTLDGVSALASLDVMINTLTSFKVIFNLLADPGVTFNFATPIIGPSWLTSKPISPTVLEATISSNPSRFASFQFVLDVPTPAGTVQVTSPDPILINSTIGDG